MNNSVNLEQQFVAKYKQAMELLRGRRYKEYYVLDNELTELGKEISSETGEEENMVWVRLAAGLEE